MKDGSLLEFSPSSSSPEAKSYSVWVPSSAVRVASSVLDSLGLFSAFFFVEGVLEALVTLPSSFYCCF